MPSFTLLPTSDAHHPLGFDDAGFESLPEAWLPQKEEPLQSASFPTPYAEAEKICAGIEFEGKPLPEHYDTLVLGLTLGHFDLEMRDLAEADDFGRALLTVEPGLFLGLLRWQVPGEPTKRLFGATHPRALVWPHARGGTFDAQWREVSEVVSKDQNHKKAMQLLAEFRLALQRKQLWDEQIPWMMGLKKILPDDIVATNDLALLRGHCRTAGPIPLALPHKEVKGRTITKLIYWPVYHENFAKDFLWSTTGMAVKTEDAIELRNQSLRQETWAAIQLPKVRQRGDRLAAGEGVVRLCGGRADWGDKKGALRLAGADGDGKSAEGLFALLTGMYTALKSELKEGTICEYPFFFPDPVRLLVDRLGKYGLPSDHRVSFSTEFSRQIIETDVGVPDTAALDSDSRPPTGCTVTLDAGPQGKLEVLYVERLGNADIGDLRALGLVLWEVFVGEAIVNRGLIQKFSDKGPSQNVVDTPADRLIAARPAYYQRVRDAKQREAIGARLATLQRFVRSYAKPPAEMQSSFPSIAKLAQRSADAFAIWVYPQVIENGAPAKEWKPIDLPGGAKLFVAIDVLQGGQG